MARQSRSLSVQQVVLAHEASTKGLTGFIETDEAHWR